MKISVNARSYVATLTLKCGNAKIEEELSKGDESIDVLNLLITSANELSRFNDISDVTFVKTIFDLFLSDSEREQFMELITEENDTESDN